MKQKSLLIYLSAVVFFIIYAFLGIFLQDATGLFIHRAILWNLFLALLPTLFMLIYMNIRRKNIIHKQQKIIAIISFIAWFLFFPNVPYLVTDFIHISPLTFYTFHDGVAIYSQNMIVWLQLFHIVVGVLVGLSIGYYSLYQMHSFIKFRYHRLKAWLFVVMVSLASGYGVFLGRFLRLNSWDILHPSALIKEIMINTSSFTWEFMIGFAAFVFISYMIFYIVCDKGGNKHN